MRRTTRLALAAALVCLTLSACAKPHEPEPKVAPGVQPNPRIKGPEQDSGPAGPLK